MLSPGTPCDVAVGHEPEHRQNAKVLRVEHEVGHHSPVAHVRHGVRLEPYGTILFYRGLHVRRMGVDTNGLQGAACIRP